MCAHISLSYLCVGDGILVHGLELPGTLFVFAEVGLAADQDDRNVSAEVPNLWEPLGTK